MNEQRNFILALVLIFALMFGFQYIMPSQQPQPATDTTAAISTATPQPVSPPASQVVSTTEAIARDERLPIEAPSIKGSIRLKGGIVDHVVLPKYKETPDSQSSEINLLAPENSSQAYWISYGWQPADPNVKTPDQDTLWQVTSGEKLTPSTPVTLTWENGQGLRFERVFTIDENYMLSVTQRLVNLSDKAVRLSAYSQVHRLGLPATSGMFILHEGAIGVFNNRLQEIDYKDLLDKGMTEYQSKAGGWAGFTDKYWLTALIPASHLEVTSRFKAAPSPTRDHFVAEMLYAPQDVQPQQTIEIREHLFAGPKQVSLLDDYEKRLNIPRFDLAIDFGWFYFLTKPIFILLNLLNSWLGNFGVSILVLTVIIKTLLFPLANKSYRSMAKMKQLQPEMQKLKERFGNDRLKMNEAMMDLYKKYQINPLAGCIPIFLQIPVFFALYKVLFVTIEMRHAPFFGWIKDLSAPDPTSLFNLFGLIPWDPPSFLMIGVWPLLMGGTMLLQQRLNPQPMDPTQAKLFMIMPIAFTALLSQFAAGLVIYWTWNNILSIAQQALIMRFESKRPQLAHANANMAKKKWKK